jgi:anti-sigma B factor antagonist
MKNNFPDPGSSQIKSAKNDGRIALSISKSITWENCGDIKKKLQSKIEAGHKEIILDFTQMPLLDSAALELLIEIHDALMSQGGVLKIAGLNEVCRDILLATRIINILFVYKDVNEAVSHKKT